MTTDPLIEQRKAKIQEWETLGFPGYARKFERSHTSLQAREAVEKKSPRDGAEVLKQPTSEASLCGRIMNVRDMGKLTFVKIRDRDGDFQICLAKDVLGEAYKTLLRILDLGDFCGFEGEFFLTKHGEPTLLAKEVTPLAKTLRPLPEKFHGITDREACYRQRYLDLATNPETFRRFRIRSQVVTEIRSFLDNLGFQEVETRILQPQAGGAMAKVFETYHNALDHNFVLRIASELDNKILVGGGIERLYEIGKDFRNEGMDPSHLQEFTMLEWYAAYADLEQNMTWMEEMLKSIIQKVIGTTKLKILDKDEKEIEVDFGKPWPRKRFPDLLKEYAAIDMFKADRKEVEKVAKKWGATSEELKKTGTANLLDLIYKKSARPHLIEPTFVIDYPTDLKPLARPKGDGTAECYQLLVAGWEIVNSYGELVDPQVQRKLLEEQAKAKAAGDEETMDVDEEFLTAMEHGFPPMTGCGIGIDRFVALITEQPNLRDVVFLPLMKPEHGTDEAVKRKMEDLRKLAKTNDPKISSVNQKKIDQPEDAKKFVAVINKKIEAGRAMNALAHMAFGLAGKSQEEMLFLDYEDQEKGAHPGISHYNTIILKAENAKQIYDIRKAAEKAGISFTDFTRTMTLGTSEIQLKATASQKTEELEYFGICLFGDSKKLDAIVGDLPLFR